MSNPPIIIEQHNEDNIEWLLSFGGSNPKKGECITLPKEQCFWLEKQIMNIDPNLLARSKER